MSRSRLLSLIILLLILSLLAACAPDDETAPQPTATTLPSPAIAGTEESESAPPAAVEAALAGVLRHLRDGYGANAPEQAGQWRAEDTTPPDLLGTGRYRFTSGPWTADISYPIVAPENTIYSVTVTHAQSGFRWQGTVDPEGNVIDAESPPEPGPSPEPATVVPPEVEDALAGALERLRLGYGVNAPEAALQWRAEYATPPDLVGSSQYRFSSGPWAAEVTVPITAPEATVFTVIVTHSQNGRSWTVTVNAAGEATEAEPSETGDWQTYANTALGYTVEVPANVTIEEAPDGSSVSFTGPLVDNEWWPILGISHPDTAPFRPQVGAELHPWLEVNLPHTATGKDITIAGLPAVHVTVEASPQAYGMDEYYLIHGGQLFKLVLLHTAGRQDWTLYNRFLNSFAFAGQGPGPGPEAGPSPGTTNQVSDMTGVIVRQPPGAQNTYLLQLEDGQQFALGGTEATQAQIQQHAWLGHRVRIWGSLHDELPGFVTVERIEPWSDDGNQSNARNEPRQLSQFATASASSELPADRLGTYHAWSAIDGNLATPWSEGAAGPGIGEWLLLTFPRPVTINRVALDVGYDYNDTVWLANNRIKQATLVFDDGEQVTVDLADRTGLQEIVLARAPGPPIVTTTVKVVIDAVYPGQVYDDTCLGEIEVWGWAQ